MQFMIKDLAMERKLSIIMTCLSANWLINHIKTKKEMLNETRVYSFISIRFSNKTIKGYTDEIVKPPTQFHSNLTRWITHIDLEPRVQSLFNALPFVLGVEIGFWTDKHTIRHTTNRWNELNGMESNEDVCQTTDKEIQLWAKSYK